MKSLEYKGEYGCRYNCGMCRQLGNDSRYMLCELQGVYVSPSNNICREFKPKIINPSAPTFNFDDYLEFLGSDFYRPWSVDTSIIVSKRWGEVGLEITASGGWRSKHGEITHYKPYDKPYCRAFMPRCHIEYDGHKFEIAYKRYRELKTVESGKIHFDMHYWKDSPNQKLYQKEIRGIF